MDYNYSQQALDIESNKPLNDALMDKLKDDNNDDKTFTVGI
jgi:hypothetical protein